MMAILLNAPILLSFTFQTKLFVDCMSYFRVDSKRVCLDTIDMNLLYNFLATFSIVEIPFIIDTLNHKYIYNAVFYQCYDNNIAAGIHKIFNEHGIKISTTKVTNRNRFEISKYMYTKSAIIINTACEGWTKVLDSTEMFQNCSFIIISEEFTATVDILADYDIQVDSDVIIALKTNSSISLYEIYHTGINSNGIFEIVNLGYWNSSLIMKEKDRKNLKGLRIKVAAVVLPRPKLEMETVEQFMEKPFAKVDTIHRMKFFTLLKYMRDMYNISYDIHRTSSWGYNRNGTFDGMVGALSRGMAEIGGSPLFFRSDRAEHIHYVSEVWTSRNSFIFRHPKYPGGLYTIYTRPMSTVVWCCVSAMCVLASIVTWLIYRLQSNKVREHEVTLSLSVLIILGALFQQVMSIPRESTSAKLATFVTLVFSVIFHQYYSATLVSSLLMETPRSIKTLQGLLDSDLKVGAHDIVYNLDYFKRTKDTVAINLYNRKIHTPTRYNFLQAADGMALVKKGGFAFHIDTVIAFPIIQETFQEKEICEIELVQMYPLQKCGVIIRRNSPYKEYLTYGIRKIYEAGLPQRIQAVTDVPMPECPHTPDSSVYCVSIREFSTPLLGLIFGIICSLIIFMVELLVSRTSKKRRVRFLH